jgi:hypothetical protein
MKYTRLFLFFFVVAPLILTGSLLTSCREDVSSGSEPLQLSVDTLSFDTVFSTVGSTTAWLTIRNAQSEPVTINRIYLRSGGSSGYRMNVDGDNGTSFEQLTIPGNDSLFLFVALTTPEQNSPNPVRVEDAIVIESQGTARQIVLKAWSWDAVIWRGKIIQNDTLITGDKPLLIYDSLVVADQKTLQIQEGATFFMHDAAKVLVYGTIQATGTLEKPVVFRGDRLDNVYSGLSYDVYPGQWHYIQLKKSSFNNTFDYTQIRGAYYGIVADSSGSDQLKFRLSNSIIHNMVSMGIYSVSNQLDLINSQVSNSGSYTVCIIGGKVRIIQCTIANYMSFVTRDGASLVLANNLVDDQEQVYTYPLEASLENNVIFGSQADELGLAISVESETDKPVYFKNCLIRTKLDLTGLQEQCLTTFSNARFFKLGGATNQYRYDFSIDSLSPARDKADTLVARSYPYDLNGQSRFADGAPDIGAYEWVPENQ